MHSWLNPVLRCEPIGPWSTAIDSQMRFLIQVPFWSDDRKPALISRVVERGPGLVVWAFDGFFQGRDRWQCDPEANGTRLTNCFEFEIPNPIVQWGFDRVAAGWTQKDMAAQLQRLKQVAERL